MDYLKDYFENRKQGILLIYADLSRSCFVFFPLLLTKKQDYGFIL